MELMLLRTFQRQVADQCKVILTGVQMINAGLQNNDQDTLWVGVQVTITGAGNTSKALWGQGARFAEQRKPLRRSLSIAENSALRDVSMRNHFEHYDERLDRWWAKSPQHNHVDRIIGPPSMIAGVDDLDRFRVYDNTTHDLVFWGERFNIQAIATEVDRILPIAQTEADKPHWEV